MSEKYKPQLGDHVRLVYEGVYEHDEGFTDGLGVFVGGGTKFYVGHALDAAKSIEKVEPDPVLPDGLTISEDGNLLNWLGENYVRQPVDEPAEVFQPGDLVRFRGTGDLYTLADEGYINHELAMFYGYQGEDAYRSDLAGKRRDDFTSKDYEKVSLG